MLSQAAPIRPMLASRRGQPCWKASFLKAVGGSPQAAVLGARVKGYHKLKKH